ncbi:flavodoxin I [Fistulifera solaris]|uniref:Flavodoxin I n=1 Tax=Fistulifera solaris TaxID=1519565 RepID=A0A1Z5J688_FISSO|nr:flavodoxin I [Fistulifera solaris]|eukprot:GAX09517.1 flavodoxin I [Fistulifera solaris]
MLQFGKYFFFISCLATVTDAWGIFPRAQRSLTRLDAAVGIFYGTSTGSTSDAAELIYEAFGADVAAEPVDVDTLDKGALADAFGQHDALIVGTPTWNTGANTERSGTGWDELYYSKMPALKTQLDGKKVAVFGLGDQVSYAENYADATGELWDVFQGLGCTMLGAWSQEGYEHEASKSIRGDKFCGLLLDAVNQEELTGERVQQWVAQLIAEGILDSSGFSTATSSASAKAVEEELPELKEMATNSRILDENIALHSSGGFKAHVNPVSGRTMWTSADGRKSFTTVGTVKKTTKP